MECQRGPLRAVRVRLTDPALVAVTIARRVAEATHAGEATAVDLLVGLASEPDGAGGLTLRERAAALVTLTDRAPAAARWAPPLTVAVGWAAEATQPRPPGTLDLLAAAVEVGGSDLADLLSVCGYDEDDLPAGPGPAMTCGAAAWTQAAEDGWTPVQETVSDAGDPPLTAPARRLLGQVRAVAGGAMDVLYGAAATRPADLWDVLGPLEPMRLLAPAPAPTTTAEEWDRGLPAVVSAVGRLHAGEADVADLVRAAVLAGGDGPRALLDAVVARARQETAEGGGAF